MARFKRKAASRSYSRSRGVVRRSGSKGGSGNIIMGAVVPGAIYGAARNPVVNTVMGFTGRFAGDYTDEIIGAGVSYMALKWGSGLVKDTGRAGLIIESASVTSKFTSGMTSTTSTSTGGSSQNGFSW